MSIFFNRSIHELKKVNTEVDEDDYTELEDDTPNTTPEDNPENSDTDDDYNLPEDEDTPEGDSENIEDTPKENPESNTENDYDLPEDSGSNEEPDNNADDDSSGPAGDESGEGGSEVKNLEDELFKNLNDGQKYIRDKELINLYIDTYNKIGGLLSKIDRVDKTTKNLSIIDFSNKKLSELQGIMYDYILSTYKTKSYIENTTNYYEFLATLDGINKILKNISVSEDE